MKTLYLHRHAKSDWNGTFGSDFERELNKRGKNDAPLMGEVLQKMKIKPDLIISSPANRAKTTASLVAGKMGYLLGDILYVDKIYEASIQNLLDVIHAIPCDADKVMLFGHNPAFTDMINLLCAEVTLDNLPTSGVIGITFDINSWKDVAPEEGEFLFFEYPKKHKN